MCSFISDEAFLILIETFLEKFCSLYSRISCLSEFHSKLHQNKYCSWVIVLVNMYCFCLLVKIFRQYFLCFSEMLLGCMIFRRFHCDTLDMGYLVIFLFSSWNLFRIRQDFLSIVFCKVEFYICKLVLFRGRLEKLSIYFLFHWKCYKDFYFVGFYQSLLYHQGWIQ